MLKTSFPPIVNQHSKVLLLGTMPGELSLKKQEYYGHKGNHFWKLIFALLNSVPTDDYESKIKLLHSKGVAVWDVLQSCEREGGADSNIEKESVNDFENFYKRYPNVKTVFFTSKQAETYYDMYVGKKPDLTYYTLPSPSRANTWKTFDEKVSEWKAILEYLN